MKKFLMTMVMALCVSITSFAQSNSDRISFGVGALYERGLDATLSWEHETKYHNAWEFFANGYVKWDNCESCGHVCPESFWKNYRTWGVGAAYKPCVWRGRNNYGNLRIGASAGSNTDKFIVQTVFSFKVRNYLKPISDSYDTFDENIDMSSTNVKTN